MMAADPARSEFADVAQRLDEALAEARSRGPEVAALVDEVLEASEEYTRAGLVALVTRLRHDPAGDELLLSCLDEPAVMALLVRHRIVRGGRPLEVLGVLESLRPYLVASSIDLEVVELDEESAVLQMSAPAGTDTVAPAQEVEQVLLTRVPGLVSVTWVGPSSAGDQAFVPVESLLRRP
jgi:hypothetical protein